MEARPRTNPRPVGGAPRDSEVAGPRPARQATFDDDVEGEDDEEEDGDEDDDCWPGAAAAISAQSRMASWPCGRRRTMPSCGKSRTGVTVAQLPATRSLGGGSESLSLSLEERSGAGARRARRRGETQTGRRP